jgi:hypothetical protein
MYDEEVGERIEPAAAQPAREESSQQERTMRRRTGVVVYSTRY